jgi:hypothetical protein
MKTGEELLEDGAELIARGAFRIAKVKGHAEAVKAIDVVIKVLNDTKGDFARLAARKAQRADD